MDIVNLDEIRHQKRLNEIRDQYFQERGNPDYWERRDRAVEAIADPEKQVRALMRLTADWLHYVNALEGRN